MRQSQENSGLDRNNAAAVAIVDDDDDVGDVLRGLLESMGYQVETYRSGAQFLADASLDRLGCLIVDQNMPRMTGLDMLDRLASKGVTIPTLLITGTSAPDLARQADRLGVMTVLEKPMSHHELLRFISFSVG